MKARRGTNDPITTPVLVLVAACVLACLAATTPARAAVMVETATGVRATIHTAADIEAQWLVRRDGRTLLSHPVAGEVELDTVSRAWSDLVPVDAGVVADVVRSLQGFQTDLAVEIFLLPGFPAEVMSSFARRESVFMAPGMGVQALETVAYVVTHELGHVFCRAAMDGRSQRWAAYRDLRGLAPQDDAAAVAHADRHREILAEDFRFLFGGPAATSSGTIENPDLPLPTGVVGLEALLAGFLADPNGGRTISLASRVYPNPCRDVAVVELDLGDDPDKSGAGDLVLEVYDIRGRLIRRLEDGRVSGGRAMVNWDGQGSDGRRAAAGVYFYRISRGNQTASGRLSLLPR